MFVSKFVCCLFLTFLSVAPVLAQDPPPDASQAIHAAETNQEGARIVDGRPLGYFWKRALHPFTWIDTGLFRPAYRVGTGPLPRRLRGASPGPVKIGAGGAGPGSGFGPIVTPVHHTFFHRAFEVETPLLYTYRNYQAYEFNIRTPAARSYVFVDGGYRSRPEDKFFGIGNDTPSGNESYFKTVHREAGVGFSARLNSTLRTTVHVGFEKVGVTEPQSGDSAQQKFTGNEIPGLSTGAEMRSATLSISHNTQDDLHRPTRGGQEVAGVGVYDSIGSGDFAFWKYRLEIQRYFSLSRDRRKIIAFRGMAESNQEKGGSSVPFFDMPYLGSWETLRGFDDYRYRDKSALAFGIEYRYRIWRALDWGFFLDKGQVAPEPGDFAWSRLHTGYGTRLFMFPSPKFPITVDLARSNETWRLYVNFNPTF